MKDEPLITITRVLDSDIDPESVGGLDYRIHCGALEAWLAVGDVARTAAAVVGNRRVSMAAELRSLADAIEQRKSPFTVTIEAAEARVAALREGRPSP